MVRDKLVEGLNSLIKVYCIFKDLDCPVIHGIYQIVSKEKTVRDVMEDMLDRDVRID